MGSSKKSKLTLQPLEEHRQARVFDTSGLGDAGVAAGSLQKRSSRKGRYLKVLRSLVKLKDAFLELMVREGNTPEGRSTAAYISMGVVMGPVDFGGYEAVSHYLARDNNYNSS